ncbi:MAG TPA: fibrobacter succinogenes major paralogous domain-containing protein [Bacteroidales bacterium]|nr:fibrobacter succinogenes major paralogous domain-containing protein [Bacteroidales bacterium]
MRRENYLIGVGFISIMMILAGCKKKDPPTVVTSEVTEVTISTAIAGGNVTNDGGAEVTARGICWSTTELPTTSDNYTSDGTGTGSFTSNLAGLTEGTTYHVRAYATNSEGTSYGEEVSFSTTPTTTATLTTAAATSITTTSCVTGGNITNDGQLEITARGVAWGTSHDPVIEGNHTTDGTGPGEFSSNLTGLTEATAYYVRAYATNSKGTSYGNEISFTTVTPVVATLTTTQVSDITPATMVSGGNITNDGGTPVTERGVCWNISPNPTIEHNKTTEGAGSGIFTSNITGLSAGTIYYVKSYATNKTGTAYGNEIKIITSISDVEGNLYRVIEIGNQLWTAGNLITTKYRDNTPIPQVADSITWMNLTTPAYSWYRNNSANKPLGALYNWFTVQTGNLCPNGWHVPSNSEFQTMEVAAGVPADSVALWGWRGTGVGTKLKDTIGWSVNTGTNVLGFSAIGSGYRAWNNSEFRARHEIVYFWSSTDDAINAKPEVAYYRRLDGSNHFIYKATTGKAGGKSVRCVKNQ